ncbi:unnamed protein product [Caenorhabditis brenneri]
MNQNEMSDETCKKVEENGSFQETDSFDEPKGVPISLEPVFSTAGKNIRIGVKQESIDKSKKMLNNDLTGTSTSSKSFSSPLIRPRSNENKAFVSPFRRDAPSTSSSTTKVSTDDDDRDFGAPPPKKAAVSTDSSSKKDEKQKPKISPKKEKKELHADVLRISRIHEKDQWRMVLQEYKDYPLILATCSYRRGKDIRFADRIKINVEVWKRNESNDITEVYIEEVIHRKRDGARQGISKHPISTKPFCIVPRLIHELSDKKIEKAVLQINILDLNQEVYEGCSSCRHVAEKQSSSRRRKECRECRDSKSKIQFSFYSRMRVMDLSGQLLLNVTTISMEKLLKMFGYDDIEQWFEYTEPQEKKNYLFRPIMVEIERKGEDDWECTDFSDVNWDDFGEFMKEKEKKMLKQSAALKDK